MKKKIKSQDIVASPITYKLKGFFISRFTIVEPGLDITSNFEIQKLKLGLNLDFSNSFEDSTFRIILTITNQYELNSKDIKLLELMLISDFEIDDIQSVIQINDEKFEVPDDLLTTFVSLTYSSARGIIFAKTQGSYLNQFILPIVDPKLLIEQRLNN